MILGYGMPMNKIFIRTIHSSDRIECSWYDKNGRRYSHRFDTIPVITDDLYGFMAFAKQKGFNIIDNYNKKHPQRMILGE
jgi:hypothetical protein